MTQLTRAEAVQLTAAVKANTQQLSTLIKKAYTGKVWVPLGYENFVGWVEGEFGWSGSRGYQLIAVATMNEDLHNAVRLPEDWVVSDTQTRNIINMGSEQFIGNLTASSTDDPKQNARLIQQMLKASQPTRTDAPISLNIPHQVPTRITGGVYDSKTALSATWSFRTQARALPKVENVPHDVLPELTDRLESTIQHIQRTRDQYEAQLAVVEAESEEQSA